MENKDGVVIPDPKTDYHGHPQYGKVYARLLILAATSLIAGFLFPTGIAIALIFFIAIIQAGLVLKSFMHIKYEPLLIWIIAISVLFTLVMLFYGVYVDITAVTRDIAK
ncbi:MAG TPA: cytochrome C oxidase subunit IV family protein [Bacteroidia bacterium]